MEIASRHLADENAIEIISIGYTVQEILAVLVNSADWQIIFYIKQLSGIFSMEVASKHLADENAI